ncbi:MAG TPA: LacI family DNA-binding transcriptional regulator [Bacteroidota bacterium]|nr:LacI family DNA-binding transcriptional regulator [Bacteroidota bacterium]
MGVTIYDIAREANVGVGTVSRVLNNHPSVSETTRSHVLEVAQRLDYSPNASAQRLARRKSRTITAIMPYITNYFFVEMLGGIQDRLFEDDYDLLLYGVNHPQQIDNYLQRSLRAGHSDGMLIASIDLPPDYSQRYLKNNFPIILVDRFHEPFDSFYIENVEGARDATRYLITLGHQRIAMIAGTPETGPTRERSKGFLEACGESSFVRNCGIHHPFIEKRNDGYSKEGGYEVMRRLLDLPTDDRPTAMFIASDIQAIGAMHALKERGLRCPEDMSIVSFDDIELAQYYGLTTMRQPIRKLGELATQRLFERMDRPNLDPLHRRFIPELIVRQTAGSPPSRFISL